MSCAKHILSHKVVHPPAEALHNMKELFEICSLLFARFFSSFKTFHSLLL